ncbi:unnamed protein product [Blepharisma stoltei]|uniref:Uncharacterized protein n=1 Tax=Blepharisma stoltei TaxID=1481888 RepID=A0AAU9JNN9_9CILI|nr:unnamed protein product [Blepharisma stoltei]
MSNYAIDITNQKVKDVMNDFGIDDNELVLKNIEDFQAPRVSPEIVKLRYDYYNRKVKDTVRRIRAELRNRRMSAINSANSINSEFLSKNTSLYSNLSSPNIESIMKIEENRLDRLKKKHKQILVDTLQALEKAKKYNEDKSQTERGVERALKERSEKFKKRLQELKEIQKEKFKDSLNSQKIYQKTLDENINKSMMEHIKREKEYEEMKKNLARKNDEMLKEKQKKIKKSKEGNIRDNENFIRYQLSSIEEKYKKSDEKYLKEINKKKEKTQSMRKHWSTVNLNLEKHKKNNEVDKVLEIIERQQEVDERKESIKRALEQKSKSKKELMRERKKQAYLRLKSEESEYNNRLKMIEQKLASSQKNIEQKEDDWRKEVTLRHELQRLKDEDSTTKVQRANRKFNFKKFQMLERQLERSHKIDELKQERELLKEKIRDGAIQAMIEKEKLKEMVALVSKSPESKAAKDKLIELNLLKQKSQTDSESEEDVQFQLSMP